jgi:hypothetical protein
MCICHPLKRTCFCASRQLYISPPVAQRQAKGGPPPLPASVQLPPAPPAPGTAPAARGCTWECRPRKSFHSQVQEPGCSKSWSCLAYLPAGQLSVILCRICQSAIQSETRLAPHLVVVVDLVQDQPLGADAVIGAQPEGRPPATRILRRHRPAIRVLCLETRPPVSCAVWWMRCDGLAMHALLCMVSSPPAAVACGRLGARVVNPPQVHALQRYWPCGLECMLPLT